MQKITPFLWFNNQAEQAAEFYTSIFKNSKIGEVMRYGEGATVKAGTAMTVTFQLEGQGFMALNGGPMFQFSPAISFFTKCTSQEEVDDLWDKLSTGGQPQKCGWLTDKFGISWQIVPVQLGEMLQDNDPAKSRRAMKAMLQMVKLDIAVLRKAFDGV